MTDPNLQNRLSEVRTKLRRGDVSAIAKRGGVSRAWASRVLHGHGVSEPLLLTAEQYLNEKKSN